MTDVALVSRSLAPFGGGGIGEYVDALARLLSGLGRVTIFTTSGHEPAYRALRAQGDPAGALAPGVEYVFVEEERPGDARGYLTELHAYGARVLDAIAERYPGGGPDLIEVPDYLGEGCVLAQAAATGDPRVRHALLAVRLHTSAEICAVLNGHFNRRDWGTQVTAELERFTLRHAHAVLWAGGDILGLYERFYGAGELGPAVRIRHPLRLAGDAGPAPSPNSPPPPSSAPARPPAAEGPLRLLYMGRLERRKGVQNLLPALTALRGGWELTLVGGDTDTAPLGGSMRGQLELLAAGDERIRFEEHLPRAALPSLVQRHDVVVLPSLWECWPYVGLEALALDRPLLATPTGGLTELVEPGRTGWHARDATQAALVDALDPLVHDPAAVRDLDTDRTAAVAALTDPDDILSGYERLLETHRPRRRAPWRSRPLVTVVVPYWRMAGFVEDTLRSIAAQTYRPIETIVVHDGSFQPDDRILAELAARYPITVLSQPNAGLGAARNFGVSQARGRYVLPLDSDNMIEPAFVERCVELLEGDHRLAYVTSWTRYVDEAGRPLEQAAEGFQPIGNECALVETNNVAGDAAAVLRKRLFDLGFGYSQDLTSYEDWELYIRLARAGHRGAVIPERLIRYRVREDSMIRDIGIPRTERLHGEMQAHTREREVQWSSTSG